MAGWAATERTDHAWTLRLSLQHLRHNCLLPALGCHGFLPVPGHKRPRIKDWVTSFSLLPNPSLLCARPGLSKGGASLLQE